MGRHIPTWLIQRGTPGRYPLFLFVDLRGNNRGHSPNIYRMRKERSLSCYILLQSKQFESRRGSERCPFQLMDDVVIPWAFGGTQMALDHSLTHSLTHSILINLFIKVRLNTLLLPPLLSITFVPSAFYAYVWHILEGISKAYI